MQLAWTGSQLLYTTMLRDNSSEAPRGTFVAWDLEFRADVHISNLLFSPADFSQPLVSITVCFNFVPS